MNRDLGIHPSLPVLLKKLQKQEAVVELNLLKEAKSGGPERMIIASLNKEKSGSQT